MHHTQTPDALSAHEEFRSRRFFGSLNGLRAFSVLAVIWHHTAPAHDSGQPYLLTTGYHGVTLFFAISGFLIVTLLLREQERSGDINLGAFYLRRTLRIFPLYYAVLAVYVVLVFLVERHDPVGQDFFRNLPYFLTYTSNWFVLPDVRVIFYFAWSLAAEEQFYLVWPTIQKFFTRRGALLLMSTVIIGVATVQLLWPSGDPAEDGLAYRMVVGIPLAICFGVVMAHALHDRRSFQVLGALFRSRWSSLLWLVVLLASLSWPAAPQVVIHAAAVLLVGACVYREDHWLAPALQWRPIAHVGVVSYGVYLLHMLVKNATLRLAGLAHVELPDYAPFLLTTLGAIAVATLSFRYFEAYFLRLKDRFSGV